MLTCSLIAVLIDVLIILLVCEFCDTCEYVINTARIRPTLANTAYTVTLPPVDYNSDMLIIKAVTSNQVTINILLKTKLFDRNGRK